MADLVRRLSDVHGLRHHEATRFQQSKLLLGVLDPVPGRDLLHTLVWSSPYAMRRELAKQPRFNGMRQICEGREPGFDEPLTRKRRPLGVTDPLAPSSRKWRRFC